MIAYFRFPIGYCPDDPTSKTQNVGAVGRMSYNEVSGLAGNRLLSGFYNRLLFTIGYCPDDPTSQTQPTDSTNILQKLSEHDTTNSVVPNQFESLSFQICFLHCLAPTLLLCVFFIQSLSEPCFPDVWKYSKM